MESDARAYELVYILPPELRDFDLENAQQRILQIIDRNDGRVTFENSWGLRKLAYPITKKTEGYYMLLHLEIPPANMASLERLFNLEETIMRYLFTRLEETDDAADTEAKEEADATEEEPDAADATETSD